MNSLKLSPQKIVLCLLAIGLAPRLALAQDAPSTNDNPIAGVVSATDGAIHQIQDELSKRVNDPQINAPEYKAWNIKFQKQLDDATTEYVERLDQEIVSQLRPLTERYRDVMNPERKFDEAHRAALSQPVIDQLNDLIKQKLTAKYQEIYGDFIAKAFPWIPKITYTDGNRLNAFAALNFFFAIPALTHEDVSAVIRFQVSRADGVGGVFKTGTVSFGEGSYTPMKDRGNSAYDPYTDVDAALTKKHPESYLFRNFVVPEVKKDCETRVCLGLKEGDLYLALDNVTKSLEVPFDVETGVSIPAPHFYARGTVALLTTPVKDPTLPFDASTPNK